ncbi:hypothetical protein F2Q69_00053885 [Brassica cretica]|uniref:Uncharacterized protein n=1 Tax=Brassica cretica TaxID=69181 RepID=A0A8S9N5M1_BRACR|nr:hypothetical protein F2Q69_00053885 [Brassica cretica]
MKSKEHWRLNAAISRLVIRNTIRNSKDDELKKTSGDRRLPELTGDSRDQLKFSSPESHEI